MSSLSPWTHRLPRFTCVSDGNPLRRLLVGSKAKGVVRVLVFAHGDLLSLAGWKGREVYQNGWRRYNVVLGGYSGVQPTVDPQHGTDRGPCRVVLWTAIRYPGSLPGSRGQ